MQKQLTLSLAAFLMSGITPHLLPQSPLLAQAEPAATNRPKPISVTELNAAMGGPTLITLNVKDATLKTVAEEFIKQAKLQPVTGYNSVMVVREPTVTLDLNQQPFWMAVKTLASKANVSFDEVGSSSDDTSLTPATGERGLRGRFTANGPVLIVANKIERAQNRSITLSETGAQAPVIQDEFALDLRVYVDPKLRIVPFSAGLRFDEITDEKGGSLIGNQPRDHVVMSRAKYTLPVKIRLNPAQVTGQRIARLKGVFHGFVVTKTERWEVPNALEARGISKAGAAGEANEKYTIEDVRQSGDTYRVQFSFQRPHTGIEGRAISELIFGQVQLVDEQGNILPVRPGSSRGLRGISDARTALFHEYAGTGISRPYRRGAGTQAGGQAGGPIKLIWDIPTEFREVEIPFEFTNLPLP